MTLLLLAPQFFFFHSSLAPQFKFTRYAYGYRINTRVESNFLLGRCKARRFNGVNISHGHAIGDRTVISHYPTDIDMYLIGPHGREVCSTRGHAPHFLN